MKTVKGKTSALVEEADRRSVEWISAIPAERARHRANAERIVLVCRDLLSARPVRIPLSPEVAEVGRLRYPGFPAEQSLLNRYGPLLRIWRDAFRRVVDVSAPVPAKAADGWALEDADLHALDHGTRSRVQLALAANRELAIENRRLRHLIGEGVPAPSGNSLVLQGGGPERILAVRTVGKFLERLASPGGPLEEVPAGLKLSRRAMPGQVVVDAELLEAIRTLSRDGPASPSGSPGVEIVPPRPGGALR